MSVRRPRPEYIQARRNGFDEFNTFPSQLEGNDAIEARDLAQFVIDNLGQPIPSIAKMKAALDAPEHSASLRDDINTLRREQLELEVALRLADIDRVKENELNSYFQTDDLKYGEKNEEWEDHYKRYDKFERFSTHHEATCFYDTFERSRYEYARRLNELQKRRVDSDQREELLRVAREAQFPQSVREYHAMDSRPAQLRVARFLMADEGKQDQMMTQSGWAWRQTAPLKKVFNGDESFRLAVGKFVQEYESRDPRSRA